MSFTINTHPVGTTPAYDARERKAQEWRHGRQGPPHGDHGQPGEAEASPAPSRPDGNNARRSHLLRTSLGGSISYLQTQEEALLTLQALLESNPSVGELEDALAAIGSETFNSLRLFSRTGDEEVFYLAEVETADPLPIPRPALDVADHTAPGFRESLVARIEEALSANRLEQNELLGIANTPTGMSPIADAESARETTLASLRSVLLDPQRALVVQANTGSDSILHML